MPDTKIFVNSIFPVQKQEIEREPAFKDLEKYNEALSDLCDEKQLAYIDNATLQQINIMKKMACILRREFYPILGFPYGGGGILMSKNRPGIYEIMKYVVLAVIIIYIVLLMLYTSGSNQPLRRWLRRWNDLWIHLILCRWMGRH